MPRRPVAGPLLLLTIVACTIVACAPEPRWIAVASTDGDLSFLDGDLRPVATWRLDGRPTALESSGDGLGILVGSGAGGGRGGGSIAWLRRTDGAAVLRREFAGPIRGLWLDRTGRNVVALVGGEFGGLRILRADSLTEARAVSICPEPVSMVFAPDGDRAYVTCHPGAVVEVDLLLGIVVRSAWLGADSGRACGAGRGDLSANGTLLYVPCAATGRLLYLDRATLRLWDSLAVGAGLAQVAVTPGAVALALLPDSDRVVLVSLRTKMPLAEASITNPVDIALSAGGRLAFILGAGRGRAAAALLEINAEGGSELRRARLPPGARAVHVWPSRREPRIYWTSER